MISVIIVANSDWDDLATPYADSILRYEPSTQIVLVDSGSKKPYKMNRDYDLIRIDHDGDYNYMKCLNRGAELARGDWLIFSNDDVTCVGGFSKRIESLPKRCLYGAEVRHKNENFGAEVRYVYGWIMVMHRTVWNEVGKFDEAYLHAGYDDIDYSWRCGKLDIPVLAVTLPFVHLSDLPGNTHRRYTVANYRENMVKSKEHFLEKVRGEKWKL